jgi:putative chitinase
MKLEDLKKIIDNQYVNQELMNAINETFNTYNISTPLRQAHFLAQILHESGNFKYTKEIADGSAYELRKDLGNTSPGDGMKYKGRGYIQLTGRYNYARLTQDLQIDLVNKPYLLEQLPYSMLCAGWYWDSNRLNAWADNDDAITITKIINGGLNGLRNRVELLQHCKEVLGV